MRVQRNALAISQGLRRLAIMSARVSIIRGGVVAIAAVLGIAIAGSTLAAPRGGGHAAGGFGGFHGGGYRGGYGGYRGGYGYRGWGGRGYYGWRGGYYGPWRGWGFGCCGWGWAGLGWYLPVLPFGYATYWWGGVPYYYANNYYYVWDGDVGQYQAVQPPAGMTARPASNTTAATTNSSNSWTDLYAYPKGGQSTEQQQRDREECRQWAVSQTGFDPAQPTHDSPSEWTSKRESYLRAEGACLTARNYSVK